MELSVAICYYSKCCIGWQIIFWTSIGSQAQHNFVASPAVIRGQRSLTLTESGTHFVTAVWTPINTLKLQKLPAITTNDAVSHMCGRDLKYMVKELDGDADS